VQRPHVASGWGLKFQQFPDDFADSNFTNSSLVERKLLAQLHQSDHFRDIVTLFGVPKPSLDDSKATEASELLLAFFVDLARENVNAETAMLSLRKLEIKRIGYDRKA
jgi:hypothetical protein